MANRRMFSLSIIGSDAFMDMPATSQLLYYNLAMRADDEGFVSNPKTIMRMSSSKDDDYKVLVGKKFIIPFENGVCVIKHWLVHNTIRMDRFNKTSYVEEKNQLIIKDNKAYRLVNIDENCTATIRQPFGAEPVPQSNLIKSNLIKDKVIKKENSSSYLKEIPEEDLNEFYSRFDCDKKTIKNKAESLYLYCQSKGKKYSNYKAFLLNALKKDIPERKEKIDTRKVVIIDGKPTLIQ